MSEGRIAVVNISLLLREEEDSQGNSVSLVSQLLQEVEDGREAGPELTSHHRQAAGHGVSEGDKWSAGNQYNSAQTAFTYRRLISSDISSVKCI